MSFKIDFTVADEKVRKLATDIDGLANKASSIAKSLQDAAAAAGPNYSKLQKQLKQATSELEKLRATEKRVQDQRVKTYKETTVEINNLEKSKVNTLQTLARSYLLSDQEIHRRKTASAKEAMEKEIYYASKAYQAKEELLRKERTLDNFKHLSAVENRINRLNKVKETQSRLTHLRIAEDTIKAYQQIEASTVNHGNKVSKTVSDSSKKRLDILENYWRQELSSLSAHNAKLAKEAKKGYDLLHMSRGVTNVKATGNVTGMTVAEARRMKEEQNRLNSVVAESKKKYDRATKSNIKLNKSFLDSANGAAAFRAAMNATGTHMGIFTGHTIAAATAVYSLVSAIKQSITIGSAFTGEMARSTAIMGANAEQSAMLEKEVRRLGETTQYTGQEAAAGLTALAMAGLTTEQAMETLAPALNLAVIGNVDMYKSADILTNVIYGFRLSASDAKSVVDDLASAITSSNSTIEQMGNALSYVAPAAAAAGANIEETIAILEIFHNAGIKGSRAGTSLRRAYVNLQAPTDKVASTLFNLGIKTKDVNGNMLELTDIMGQMAEAGATSADIATLFGARAYPAMQVFFEEVKRGGGNLSELRKQLENNGDVAEEMRQKFEDFFGADMRKLLSALEEKALQVFEVWEDGLRSAAQSATEWVKSLDPTKIAKTIAQLASMADALATVAATMALLKITSVVAKFMVTLGSSARVASNRMKSLAAANKAVEISSYRTARSLVTLKRGIRGLLASTGVGAAFVGVGLAVDYLLEKFVYAEEGTDDLTESLKQLNNEAEKVAENKAWEFPLDVAKATMEDRKKLVDLIRETSSSDPKLNYYLDQLKEFDNYIATGLNSTGMQKLKEYKEAIEDLAKLTTIDLGKLKLAEMGRQFKQLSKDTEIGLGGTEYQQYRTKISAIREVSDAYEESYRASKLALSEQIKQAEELSGGDFSKALELKQAEKKLDEDRLEFQRKLRQEREKAVNSFTGIDQADDMISLSISLRKSMEEEIEMSRLGITTREEETLWRLKNAKAILEEKLSLAEGKGLREEEINAMRDRLSLLGMEIESYSDLTKAKRDAENATKAREDLEKKYNQGFGLSEEQRAESEYSEKLEALRAYAEEDMYIREGLAEREIMLEREKADKIAEIQEKRLRSQNEWWFNITDNAAKSIGENISQVAVYSQTWEEASGKIEKAIIGGIIQSLAEYSIKKASLIAAEAIWGATEVGIAETTALGKVGAKSTEAAGVISLNNAIAASNMKVAVTEAGATAGLSVPSQTAGMTVLMTFMQSLMSSLGSGLGTSISGSREIGGPVMAGHSYLVGEKGPEIFTPSATGQITSNADINRRFNSSSSGETHTHIYEGDKYYIDATDAPSFRRMLASEGAFISQIGDKHKRNKGRKAK